MSDPLKYAVVERERRYLLASLPEGVTGTWEIVDTVLTLTGDFTDAGYNIRRWPACPGGPKASGAFTKTAAGWQFAQVPELVMPEDQNTVIEK